MGVASRFSRVASRSCVLRRRGARALSTAQCSSSELHANAAGSPMHHSTAFLSEASELELALVVLNVDRVAHLMSDSGVMPRLWREADARLCADGAANRLHDALAEPGRSQMLPTLIKGDLDSLRDDVASFYRGHGVAVERDAAQDTHDFEKCLRWLCTRQADLGRPLSVVTFGAFGGRLDQTMANLNMVYKYAGRFERFLLLSDECLAFLLPPGRHVIEPNAALESGTCGLVPLGGRCDRVRTTGLRWDLDGETPLLFGGVVSTSNEVVAPRVTVENAEPLLWTSGFRYEP